MNLGRCLLPFEQFQEAVSTVPNAITQATALIMYGLIRGLRPTVVLEIGTFCGYTACWLSRALQENGSGHLWIVDNFTFPPGSAEMVYQNLDRCGVADRVTILEKNSQEILWSVDVPTPIDFAFIDGDHAYDVCSSDVENCLKGLSPRGMICIHDVISTHDVHRLWAEIVAGDITGAQAIETMRFEESEGLGVIRFRIKPTPSWQD